ncbi:MAG: hypothetical protein UW27_C0017G0089 [Parcubacteria group bacterium GW2011_GWA1_44_13]|uniref:Uncharacterized protein n=1 Tax=Candidatus Nomurabacteria bacterium GW2011_GWB1_44_12 TaxID=1618748 RepID=A0A837I9H2_9BACT|nr:MAG: hypothetical protein UW17_C0003G0008 [Candidatus Nomurabacteria bacterium GW2011_GWD1_44_10]KKT36753.1 MAG: hypothetical protein UW25_C0004G0081 [Candidatus Nomurabacteria bacterium GW2011_GWB1_44_12]KKT37472.1 MAG: hypothetical protein UW27_C0017G0089 [Parcubacteria group bacterium GW2011_GWA1_44_13]KKT59829.1 MAG: hypothetical protein UW54_C0019G0002 [Parcubacteria group bacterium GW2011_GWC1_44_26]HBB43778.1 hypothetical protein [Candidatus Yonathbacteria bacterium]
MGKDRHSIELEDAHNKGEQDAAAGRMRDEPYGFANGFAAQLVGKDSDEIREENDAYEKGYQNTMDQKSSRVICTHFYRKGLLPQNVWRADMKFTASHLSETTVRGYHFWAIPYVELMRKSTLAESIMFPVAKWRAEELAYQMGELPSSNFKGKIVRLVVEPACWLLGCLVGQKDWKVLYSAG